ncbi:MAG: hypothetical protein GC171_03250 [Terrimonas sp.]|nr:hypothetical protein [Terrimonas sp.]
MKKSIVFFLLPLFAIFYSPAQGQILKKLKQKVEDKLEKKVTGNPDNSTGTQPNSENPDNNSGNKPTNKGGGGLTNTTPPDVLQQMTDAEKAHDAGQYSDARYAVQQALIGVEIQLGKELLQSLPDMVSGLPKDTLQDKVMSNQWGWNNMTIQRVYYDNKDKQLTITIGNNSFYAGFVNMYFNSAYTQSDGNNQNTKQVRVKGNKAIIQYDDSKGYTLIVPLGQSSMIVWECINFADENEVIKSAEAFDIDDIKRRMGEQ